MMKIRNIKLADLVPYEGNPRRNEAAVAKVVASIEAFGFRVPIVADENLVILAGHTRLLAAQELGLKTVPVHVAEGLTEDQKRAYRIADNRVAEESEWDEEKLRAELEALQGDFDLSLTGFDEAELANKLHFDDPDVDGEPPADTYREQFGVIVTCKDAKHQERVYQQLLKAGHDCKVVVT